MSFVLVEMIISDTDTLLFKMAKQQKIKLICMTLNAQELVDQ